jgi:RNA recognition motif-containing protein
LRNLFHTEEDLVNIYVGNLSFDAGENDLREAFNEYGHVEAVSIITDRQTGRSRGFGFVEMPNADEAKAAIEGLNLQRLGSRAMTVNEARPRASRGGGQGGRW